jgi:hypothetical protein
MSKVKERTGFKRTAYRTQHFQVQMFSKEEGVLTLRDSDTPLIGSAIPAQFAALVVEAVEQGYHRGFKDATAAFGEISQQIRSEMLGPIRYPLCEALEPA